MSGIRYPAPVPDPDSAPFWDGLARGELILLRCSTCRGASFPLTSSCPHCGSARVATERATGLGRVYSWVTTHHALHEAFAGDVPYTVLAVTVEEGPRVLGRLVHAAPDAVEAAMPVVLSPVWEGGIALPAFRPRRI